MSALYLSKQNRLIKEEEGEKTYSVERFRPRARWGQKFSGSDALLQQNANNYFTEKKLKTFVPVKVNTRLRILVIATYRHWPYP